MPNTNLHYPTGYYGPYIDSAYNNNVRRRLSVRDNVSFSQSTRFAGQYIESKGSLRPYDSTVMTTVGACQQLVSELNLAQAILPEMGNTVILNGVGVATNFFHKAYGIATHNPIGVTTIADSDHMTAFQIDGVSIATGLTILYQGLTTASLNGVYQVVANGASVRIERRPDLRYWWQFVKPKVFMIENGTANKAKLYGLTVDAWEVGSSFSVALGTSTDQLYGTGIGFAVSSYSYGLQTSLIAPAYTALAGSGIGTFEYSFFAQNAESKLVYLKNRAERMAYWLYKLRENYNPSVSSYGTNNVIAIGFANSQRNIGQTFGNDLRVGANATSRYPSSFNRGW